jgi:hypothetical protein
MLVPLLAALMAATPAVGAWPYRVQLGDAGELQAWAHFPAGVGDEFSVDDGAEPFVSGVAVQTGAGLSPVSARGSSWFIPSCKQGCEIRYHFALRSLARRADSVELAKVAGPVVVSAPAAWLLRPLEGAAQAPLELSVETPKESGFDIGWPVSRTRYQARAADIRLGPYAAFGPMEQRSIRAGTQTVRLSFAAMKRTLSTESIAAWMQSCCDAVRLYDGAFPIDQTLVLVLPGQGRELFGKTLGAGGATVLLWLGPEATEASLREEWVLVHELTHLMLPTVSRPHHWMEEGVATYVEPLARLRVGQLKPEQVWQQLTWGLPQGLPKEGDRGLDHTPTWGRTYWGGALFWFLADVRIRERTENRCSVQDALRGIREAGGNLGERWPVERVLGVGDARVKGHELEDLYAELAPKAAPVDLEGLFKRLGVKRHGDQVVLDPKAPESHIREGITSTTPSRCP